jgi:trehalose 6-phosphate synthase/phosphatase
MSFGRDSLGMKNRGARPCRIYFHAAFTEVSYPAEEVRVVGDHPSLGSGVPENGLVLTTHEDIFPCWISSEPMYADLHSTVKYKYCVTDKDGKLKVWEDREEREFTASGPEMTIEDDEGLYRHFSGAAGGSHEAAESLTAQLNFPRTPEGLRNLEMSKAEKLLFVKELEGEVTITRHDTVFMFHFDLPFKVERKEGGGWKVSESSYSGHFIPLIKELKRQDRRNIKFIGWPGIHPKTEREKTEIGRFLEEYDCIPVFPPPIEFQEFLDFTDNFLWPIFHDVQAFFQTSSPPPFNEQGWGSYQHINNLFANQVVAHAHDSDLIWIHDYQLMMMPTFISRKLARANIGFYLHAPFPSSDTFKSLPIREELLSGMLCADQVGFQFFASARNFVVSCKRIYGLDPTFKAGGFIGLDYNGRTVAIKVAHFGLPYQETKEIVNSDLVEKKAEEVRKLFEGKTVVVCQDRCRGVAGLSPKFRDFKRFLNENQKCKGKVILVQYVNVDDCDDSTETLIESLKQDADAFVETNEETGALTVVAKGGAELKSCDIYLRYEQHDREDRLALFRAGHVLFDASIKAGLNLIPFDFVTAHHDDSSNHSLMIVSEFSGCSRVLLGSLRINPWNSSEVVAALERAVSMADAERQERWEMDLAYLSEYSPVQWFEEYITDLRRARKKEGMRIESIGFGARIRPVAVSSGFERLPIDGVMRSMAKAKRRVFFLDNEGTLAPDKRRLHREYGAPKGDFTQLSNHGTGPDEKTLECLRELASDSRNTVVILSGRSREQLEAWFSSVPKIGLAAERGFYFKLPSVTGDQWLSPRQVDITWKEVVFELMRQFVRRTQGACIENKGSALVWQYRDADQHYGSWQAKELSSTLKQLLFGFDVEVVEGKGYVEVKLSHINKGVAVAKILSKVAKTFGEADFVLCCGDDRSDEDMFEVVNFFTDNDKAKDKDDTTSQQSTTDDQDESEDTSDKETKRRPSGSLQMLRQDSGGESGLGGLKKCKSGQNPGESSSNLGLLGTRMGSIAGDLQSLGAVMCADEDSATNLRYFTCVVGRKPSAAKFFLNDTDEMSELLQSLAAQQRRRSSTGYSFRHEISDRHLGQNAQTWTAGREVGSLRGIGSMPTLSSMGLGGQMSGSSRSFASGLNAQG